MPEKTENFEIVNFKPPKHLRATKFGRLNMELAQLLLKVPPGKSIRRSHAMPQQSHAYAASVKGFLKTQKLTDTYFVSASGYAEADGKFYVYIGRKDDAEKE